MPHNFPTITNFPGLNSLVKKHPNAEVYLVGGAVRDCLRNKKVTDYDMLVRNVSGEELESFLAHHGRVVFAGKNFGVWKFSEIGAPPEEVYDIALPRTEFSLHKQGMYKDFKVRTNPTLPIEDDLQRRDFTINAMALNLVTNELIDPHDGQTDLKNKIIRTVGSAQERFQEDYSRILRALRFSIQLGCAIEPKTYTCVREMITCINNEIDDKRVVPYEIISEEFLKSLLADPVAAISLWHESGALAELLPELLQMRDCPQPTSFHTEGDVWTHTMLAITSLYSERFAAEFPNEAPDLELILATLLHDIGKPYTLITPEHNGSDRIRFNEHEIVGSKITQTILERIKASAPPDIGITIERVAWLVRNHMLLVHSNPLLLKETTIEKYFFNAKWPSRNLIKLMLVDGLATIGATGVGYSNNYEALCQRMEEIRAKTGSRGFRLVQPLLSGNDIMETLNVPPSKIIGTLLEMVRQKQLSGELKNADDARAYITTIDTNSLQDSRTTDENPL